MTAMFSLSNKISLLQNQINNLYIALIQRIDIVNNSVNAASIDITNEISSATIDISTEISGLST